MHSTLARSHPEILFLGLSSHIAETLLALLIYRARQVPSRSFCGKEQPSQAALGKPCASDPPWCQCPRSVASLPLAPHGEPNLLLSEFHQNRVTAVWDSALTW